MTLELVKGKYKTLVSDLIATSRLSREEFRLELSKLTGRKWPPSVLHYYETGRYNFRLQEMRYLMKAAGLSPEIMSKLLVDYFLKD